MNNSNRSPDQIIDNFCEINEQLIRTSSLQLGLAVRGQMFSIISERFSNMHPYFTTVVAKKTPIGV